MDIINERLDSLVNQNLLDYTEKENLINSIEEKKIMKYIKENKDDLGKNIEGSPDADILNHYFDICKERERNLIIKITNALKNKTTDTFFSETDMKEKFFFKKSDVEFYKFKIFDENSIEENTYILKPEIKEKIDNYIEKHKEYASIPDIKKACIREFSEKFIEIKKLIYDDRIYYEANKKIEKLMDTIEKIHWIYLPIYREQIIKNRRVLPEENLRDYYNHIHALEDLNRSIINEDISWKSLGGDNLFDEKFNFDVYNDRYGYDDRYEIKKTIYGWDILSFSEGISLKNGVGELLNALDHDFIFYPKKGVLSAFEQLWNKADSKSMNKKQVQKELQEIADWISDVERNLRRNQPTWVNYY